MNEKGPRIRSSKNGSVLAPLGRHVQLCWVRLATAVLQELLRSLRSHSCSSAGEQPAGPGARVAFLEEREQCDCMEDVVSGTCGPLGPNTRPKDTWCTPRC